MESSIEALSVVLGIMSILLIGAILLICKNTKEMSEEEKEKGELIHTWYERTDMYIYEHKIYEHVEETITYERLS